MLETDRHTYSGLIRYQGESATFVIRCQERQEGLRIKIGRQTSLTEFTSTKKVMSTLAGKAIPLYRAQAAHVSVASSFSNPRTFERFNLQRQWPFLNLHQTHDE